MKAHVVREGVYIGRGAKVSDGSVLGSDIYLEDGCTVGESTVVESSVRVGKGSRIHPRCFIGKGARMGKNNNVGTETRIGERTVIYNSVKIGEHCTIGKDVVIKNNVCLLKNVRLDHGTFVPPCAYISLDDLITEVKVLMDKDNHITAYKTISKDWYFETSKIKPTNVNTVDNSGHGELISLVLRLCKKDVNWFTKIWERVRKLCL